MTVGHVSGFGSSGLGTGYVGSSNLEQDVSSFNLINAIPNTATSVILSFDSLLADSVAITDITNYSINNGIIIAGAFLSSATTITLNLNANTPLITNNFYTVIVSSTNIKNLTGGTLINNYIIFISKILTQTARRVTSNNFWNPGLNIVSEVFSDG